MSPHAKRTTIRRNDGFTMVIIAALFIAFAVVGAVVIERAAATQYIKRRDATTEQLRRLSYAIMQYGIMNSGGGGANTTMLYPCPALETLLTSDVNFGTAVSNCYDSSTDSGGKTNTGIPIMGTGVIRGMVPVQILAQYGININDAFDPWNNRIEYVVNRNLTPGSPSIAGAQSFNPSITEPETNHAVAPPDFILISYGRDGLGGIRRGNTVAAISCPGAGTVLRQYNCGVTLHYYVAPTYTAATATSANYFDDILSYYRQ